eukprot:UN02220
MKKKELSAQKENMRNLAEGFSIKQSSKSISNQRVLTRKQGKGKKTKKAKKHYDDCDITSL